MAIGFESKNIYEAKEKRERYVGKWVAVYTSRQIFLGKVDSINEEKIILKPSRGEFYPEGKLEIGLVHQPLEIERWGNSIAIEFVGEKWVKERIFFENNKNKKSEEENNPTS